MKLKINEALENLPKIDYRQLTDLQGNLKELSENNFNKAVKSIERHGFFVPFFVWQHKGKNYILDGHQRHNILTKLDAQPYELPAVFIQAKTEKEAKEKLLLINSQYGRITKEGFDAFTFDLDTDFLTDVTTLDFFVDAGQINIDELFSENQEEVKEKTFKIVLEYTESDFNTMTEAFKKYSGSKESIVFKLLTQ